MTRLPPVLFAAALALVAPAAAPLAAKGPRLTEEEKLQKTLAGLVPGKPVDCIHQGPFLNSTTFDGAILYRDGNTRYLNRFGGSCNIRADFDTIITRTYSGQLCRGDIARVIETGSPIERASCVFDNFVPYSKPK